MSGKNIQASNKWKKKCASGIPKKIYGNIRFDT